MHGRPAANIEKPRPAIQKTLMITACHKPCDFEAERSRNKTQVIRATKAMKTAMKPQRNAAL